MKIRNLSAFQEPLVCVSEFWITLEKMRPPRNLVSIRVENSGQCHDQRLTEVIRNIIGVSFLVLNVKMELFQICGPFLMAIVLQLSLCLYEWQGSMVYVDECFLPHKVMLPLSAGLHNGIHLFVIDGILLDCVWKCLTMICQGVPLLSKNCTNNIVKGISFNLKRLMYVS